MAVDSDNARIGIYLCKCGGNIGDVIDIEAIRDMVRAWDGVVVSRFDNYLCSKPAQDIIYQDIERFNLNRIIVASCTPRMHLQTFREVLERAGLNPYFLEFVNIREQCSWVHGPVLSVEAINALNAVMGVNDTAEATGDNDDFREEVKEVFDEFQWESRTFSNI